MLYLGENRVHSHIRSEAASTRERLRRTVDAENIKNKQSENAATGALSSGKNITSSELPLNMG
jgi:hypothetical protein